MPASTPSSLFAGAHWCLGFPAEVEARFEADTGPQRSRAMTTAALLCLLVFDLFLVNDAISRPEVLALAMVWRLGVVTVPALVVLAAVWRGVSALVREAAIGGLVLLTLAGACAVFDATRGPSAIYDPFLFGLIFLAGNIVLQLRFVAAAATSALGLVMTAAFMLHHPTLPSEARTFAFGMQFATALLTVMACYRLERAERQAYLLLRRETERSQVAQQAADAMATLSMTDALTGLANRRAFDLELPRRWNEAAQQDLSMAALMVDIDHFKRFNDRYGHPAGDECLRQVAAVMRSNLREGDFLARVGGEEFAVLLSARQHGGGLQFAERLRRSVEEAGLPAPSEPDDAAPRVVTVSVGMAQVAARPQRSPQALLAAADQALYRAKETGRNRCVEGQALDAVDGVTAAPAALAVQRDDLPLPG